MTDFEYDDEDLSEMFGEEPRKAKPPTQRRGRIKASEYATAREHPGLKENLTEDDIRKIRKLAVTGRTVLPDREFFMPAPARFFARVLHMDDMTVNRRLRRVQPDCYEGSRPLWEFGKALPYLIKPRMDKKTFLESVTVEELPLHLQESIWKAKSARLKYLKESAQTWSTEHVMATNAELNKEMSERIELWYDTLYESAANKSVMEVMEGLRQQIDDLRSLMHAAYIELPAKSQTLSIFGEEGDVDDKSVSVEDDDE